jgi:hypothetical protein
MKDIIEQFFVCNINVGDNVAELINYLKACKIEDILEIIKNDRDNLLELHSSNIPQFSNIEEVDKAVQIVFDAVEDINYQYIGYMLNKNANPSAQTKYGENHLKLAIQMGLVSSKPYQITSFGKRYLLLSDKERNKVRSELFLRVPIIQKLLILSEDQIIDGTEMLKTVLSEKTAIRRRSNLKTLIGIIKEEALFVLQKQIINNIRWS